MKKIIISVLILMGIFAFTDNVLARKYKAVAGVSSETWNLVLKGKPLVTDTIQDIRVRDINDFGLDYVGKTVRIDAQFVELNDLWKGANPLLTGADPSSYDTWIGFFIRGSASGDLYQYCFANRDQFKDILLSFNRGDSVEITGIVFDFLDHTNAGLLVTHIESVKHTSIRAIIVGILIIGIIILAIRRFVRKYSHEENTEEEI